MSISVSPSPVSKACGLFSNRVLLPFSGIHPREMAIAYMALGVRGVRLLHFPDQQL